MGGRGEYYKNKYGKRKARNSRNSNDGVPNATSKSSWTSRSTKQSRTILTKEDLQSTLRSINRKTYGAYREIENRYFFMDGRYPFFCLTFDRIQSDAYAPPSLVHIRLDAQYANFPRETFHSKIRKVALGDYLSRKFAREVANAGADRRHGGGSWHEGKGGEISVNFPAQHVLDRTSVRVHDSEGAVEVRFSVGLPAKGRSICGDWAAAILTVTLPELVKKSLLFQSLDHTELWKHIRSIEDQETLRNLLRSQQLVAFVNNGAILPRQTGASDKPLTGPSVVPFKSPPSMEVEFTLPNRGLIKGMGIKEGVTLFVGGGFHGKTTILKALQVGVYNHVPGDGREFVVTDPNCMKIRAEDSRSPFINHLPHKKNTTQFTTPDASGSTSQAANIMESIEGGATTLLIDEDTCATNFMIRDSAKEPITPFISKVRLLFDELSVSSVLVVGGAGEYFNVADAVVMMDEYEAKDVTSQAKQIALDFDKMEKSSGRQTETEGCTFYVNSAGLRPRCPISSGFSCDGRMMKTCSMSTVKHGDSELDLSAVEQLVETGQTRLISDIVIYAAKHLMKADKSMKELLDSIEELLDSEASMDVFSSYPSPGLYVRPRRLEIAAFINRMRTAIFVQKQNADSSTSPIKKEPVPGC